MSQVAVSGIGLDHVGILTDDFDSVGRVPGELIGLEYGPSIEVVGQPPPDGSD